LKLSFDCNLEENGTRIRGGRGLSFGIAISLFSKRLLIVFDDVEIALDSQTNYYQGGPIQKLRRSFMVMDKSSQALESKSYRYGF
jgi:hypothetical protein